MAGQEPTETRQALAKEPRKLSVSDVQAFVNSEKQNALAAIQAAKLMEERADSMDYYLGRMEKDMPVPEGRSEAVSTDVADAVEGILPNLMDIFAGSDEVMCFEPVGPEDEDAAAQETDYINHVFMQQNSGFMVLYSFIKDALLSKTGIVKVWWEEREEEERETYYGLDEQQLVQLLQDVQQSKGAMRVAEFSERPADEEPEIEGTS